MMIRKLTYTKILGNERGGGNLLLVFVISIMVLTLISAVASYSLIYYRNHFRVKESYKMVEVMENLAKVVRRGYDRNKNGCGGGFTQDTTNIGGKATIICLSNTLAQRCVPDPENPALSYCINSIANDLYAKNSKEPVFDVVKVDKEMKPIDDTPMVAKLGYQLDVAFHKVQGVDYERFDPHKILSPERAIAQGSVAGETWAPAAVIGAIGSIKVMRCNNAGDRALHGENYCMSCDATDPADAIGPGTGSVRCVSFRTCPAWDPSPCAGNFWRQKIAIIDTD